MAINTQITNIENIKSVSVIIPTFNNAATIERAILSAIRQGQVLREVLVYDDASTDKTSNILNELAKKFDLIKLISAKKNKGAGFSRKYLLGLAEGDYIAFLDADDYWLDNKIEQQMSALKKYAADICTTNITINDENENYLSTLKPKIIISKWDLVLQNPIPTSSVLFSAKLKGVLDMPIIRTRQDYAYWIMIFSKNESVKHININSNLTVYIRSHSGLSGNKIKNIQNNYFMYRQAIKLGILVSVIRTSLNVVGKLYKMFKEKIYG